MLFEYKSTISDSLKDVDRGKREMVGVFANYETRDMVGDLSMKGMFDRTWREQKARVKHVYEHDMTKPIGKIQDLWDDQKGAYYRSRVGTHKFGDDVLEMADSGLLDEHSFGFKTVRAKPAGVNKRDLLEVKHFEVTSVGGWAIHGKTPLLTVKKALTEQEGLDLLEKMEVRYKSLEKFCRNTSASDETIEFLLLEIKQLQQRIVDLSTSSTLAADKAPEPQTGLSFDVKAALALIEVQKQSLQTV